MEARIRRPVILLGAPRTGTTMLFNALSSHPDLWSLYRESDGIIERYFPVTMEPGASDVVEADDVSEEAAAAIRRDFVDLVGNMGSGHLVLSKGASAFLRTPIGRRAMKIPGISRLRLATIYSRARRQPKQNEIRMVEKTPENSFRVQLLKKAFPDAQFVYIVRDPRQSIASIYTGWTKSTEFRRFRFPESFHLRDHESGWWSFGLVPGWEDLNGATVMEVCAQQWVLYNRHCRRDLPPDGERTLQISYEDMVTDAPTVLRRIAEWSDLDPQPFERFDHSLPVVNTFSRPQKSKWLRLESELGSIAPLVREEAAALGYEL